MTAEEFVTGSWEITPKLMFIRKGGKAIHLLGDLSRDYYNAEPIVVQREDADNWIGYYAEGFGFYNVKFAKEDCKAATEEDIKKWRKDHDSIKF